MSFFMLATQINKTHFYARAIKYGFYCTLLDQSSLFRKNIVTIFWENVIIFSLKSPEIPIIFGCVLKFYIICIFRVENFWEKKINKYLIKLKKTEKAAYFAAAISIFWKFFSMIF